MSLAEIRQRIQARKGRHLTLALNYTADQVQESYDGNTEPLVSVHIVSKPTIEYNGIRYQRCGGGRRVIRRQIGGD